MTSGERLLEQRQGNFENNQLIKITQEVTQTVELEIEVTATVIRMGLCVSADVLCYHVTERAMWKEWGWRRSPQLAADKEEGLQTSNLRK